ncbi:hypothetical protein B0A48_11100 [Cryoendolithus antarcticus]|uniref:DUF7779 domain-containing protein n=1 Tax=Cryoendolithus antarcticus TaxID=1507870 RepID=A0A1V8SUE9_9PEZI|nr:hypothetical protein B0A48_11100 [Cryoendolithus antarcticus]
MAAVQQRNTFGDTNYGTQIGTNYGVSNNNVYSAPEQPESPPTPCAILPYRRDPAYVHRAAIYERLEELAKPNARVALCGLGGAGKSQLALEYAYRLRDKDSSTFALWIHASTFARFEQNVKELVANLRVPGRRRPDANVFELLQNWLIAAEYGSWVLIIDNLDDRSLLRSKHDYDGGTSVVAKFTVALSNCTRGCVVVTSRDRDTALELVDGEELIEVGPMEAEHARTLLHARLGSAVIDDEVDELAAALDYMPLAMTQAAVYIRQRAPRFSVAAYLEALTALDETSSNLLTHGMRDLRRHPESENAIFKAWQISFDHIRALRSSAADLLALMCFFDRQAIPESALHELSPIKYGRPTKVDDEFETDVTMLRDYSFISVTTAEATTFDMHRLVQKAAQTWLRSEAKEEFWKSVFVDRLYDAFPRDGLYEYWSECEVLFPHVKSAMTMRWAQRQANIVWAAVLFRAAEYALQRGSPSDGLHMAQESQQVRGHALGSQHQATLRSTALTVRARWSLGNYRAAQQNGEKLLHTMRKSLGATHFYTLDATNDLALVFTSQGKWWEAEYLHRLLLHKFESVSGRTHPNTLLSKNNLAVLYAYQGKHDVAAELHREILYARQATLGADHPHTVSNMHNLAVSYWANERHDEAEALFRSALEKRRKTLGEEHLNTLTSLDSLAGVLRFRGDLVEAETMARAALNTREKILGAQHPDVLTSKANLALILHDAGQKTEACALNHNCAVATCAVLGDDHPSSVTRTRRDAEWADETRQGTITTLSKDSVPESETASVQESGREAAILPVTKPITLDPALAIPDPPKALLLSHVLPTESLVFDAVQVTAKQLARLSVRATAMSSPDPNLYLDPREAEEMTRRHRGGYEFGSTLSSRYIDRRAASKQERRHRQAMDSGTYRFGEPYSFQGTATSSLRGRSPDARIVACESRWRPPVDESFMFEKTTESSVRGISPDLMMSDLRIANEAYQFIRTEQTSLSCVPHEVDCTSDTPGMGESSGLHDFEGNVTSVITGDSDDDYTTTGEKILLQTVVREDG